MIKPHYRLAADGSVTLLRDGFQNVVAGLETARDKANASDYVLTWLDHQSLLAAYRSAWLPRAIVDIPALDAVRKWRAWQAEPDQITAIEATEKRLNVREKVRDTLTAARLYGGAALLMLTADKAYDKPLAPERIGRDGLHRLVPLTPMQLQPGEVDRDVTSDWFGQPAFYTLSGPAGQPIRIHPSRLVVFHGAQVPDAWAMSAGWGDSVLLSAMQAIKQADATVANIASLIFEAKVDVVHIPRLRELLLSPGGEAALITRLSVAARAKGINGMMVLEGGGQTDDKGQPVGKEEYEQKQASFGTLPDLMDRFMLNVSGAAKIPVSRLFGRSAAGMNATGDGDERVYFDHIQSMQELEMQPAMRVLDEALIRSALGARPDDIWYRWQPLRQESAKERAEVFKMVADAARTIAGTGGASPELLPIDALSDALANRLIEDGSMPGLEPALEEFGRLADQEDDEDEAPAAPPGTDPAHVADAAPRTLYVRRDVVNRAEIARWARAQGFADIVPDLHVTIAYSRTPVDWFKVGQSWSDRIEIAAGGPRQMDRFGDHSVLLITASELVWRHREIADAGASWDWPDYQPHISIQIGGEIDLEKVEPYRGKIVLGPEIFEEVRED